MPNLRIVTENHVDTASLSSSPTPSPSTDLNNLKEEARAKVVRFEANSFGVASLPADTGGPSTAVSLTISSDNTKAYLSNGSTVYQFSTNNLNGSIANLTYSGNSGSVLTTASDIFISSDGLKLIVAYNTVNLYIFTLGTAWDISTLAYTNFKTVQQAKFITFSPDGLNLYLGSGDAADTIYHWTLSSAWDITTATDTTNSLNVSTEDTYPSGICFNSSGTKLYVAGDSTNTIYQYTLSTAWDISTAQYGITGGAPLVETTTGQDLLETTTGLQLLETGTGAGVSLDVSTTTTTVTNININPDEDKYVYLIGQDTIPNDAIYHYGMQTEGDISTAELLSGGIQKIFANFSAISNVSAIVLGRHNLVKDSTIRIYLYDTADQVGEIYDSGIITITADEAGSETSTWGDFIWGAVPWGTVVDEFGPPKNFVHWIDPQIVSALSIEIVISVPTNQVEIGRLFIGTFIEPTYNLELNHSIVWEESTKQYRSEEGTLRSDIGLPARKLEFSLEAINSSDRTLIQHSLRDVGLREDFYINLFPDDPDINKELDYSGIVKLVQEPKFSEYAPLYYKSKYVMEEV